MITPESMGALVLELEKTAAFPAVAAFMKHYRAAMQPGGLKAVLPNLYGGVRNSLRGQYGRQMLVGAGAGGLLGAVRKPGTYQDEEGNEVRHSRLGNIAQGALLGAGAVGAGALATKGGRAAAKKSLSNFGARTRYQFTGKAPGVSRMDIKGAKSQGILGEKATPAEMLAHAEGWNTIPGMARGLVRSPGKVIRNAWSRMDTPSKVITGIQAADTVREAATPTEAGGPGRAERVLGSLAGNLGFMVAPSGLLPGLAVGSLTGAAGSRLGRVLDHSVPRPSVQPQAVAPAMPAQLGAI